MKFLKSHLPALLLMLFCFASFNKTNAQASVFGYQKYIENGDTLNYDAENRMATATEPVSLGGGTETYLYDGDGKRVEKIGPGGATVYVYDALAGC